MSHYIYKLIDPQTGEVRYIGITNEPARRYLHHLNCSDLIEAKGRWIQSLLSEELKPVMDIIESTENRSVGYERERYWIKAYLAQGAKLLNVQHGIVSPVRYEVQHKQANVEDILSCYSNPQVIAKVQQNLNSLEFVQIEVEDIYDIQDLFDCLPITLSQVAQTLEMPEYTLTKLVDGEPVWCTRVKLVLTFFCWIYQKQFSLENVSGISLKDKDKYLLENRLQGPAYCWLR